MYIKSTHIYMLSYLKEKIRVHRNKWACASKCLKGLSIWALNRNPGHYKDEGKAQI